MLIILLTIYIFARDVAGEIDCDKQFFEQCERPKLLNEIPRDVEVFNSLCPKVSPYIECSRDYDIKCEEEDRRRYSKPEKYDEVVDLFDSICKEGTFLNIVVTRNLKCFNETFSNTNCPQKIYDFVDSAEKKIPLEETTTPHLNDENISCMSMILLAKCIVEDITRNCDISGRFATDEILRRIDFIGSSCPLSFRKYLLQIIDEFSLTEEQKTFATAELERMAILDAL